MAAQEKMIGIIGGMGPEATVNFMSQIIALTPATIDQDHIRMMVESNPKIPSRQSSMRGEGEDPGAAIAAVARRLQDAGADFIVMPCNLAHAWQRDIEAAVDIPFISIVDVTVSDAVDRSAEDSPVGLMTTPGCFAAGLYQQALADADRIVVTQTPDELEETMSLVYRIKSSDTSAEVAAGLKALADRLLVRGAKVIVAACTEFPLVLDASMFPVAYISPTDALARKAVSLALEIR